MIVPRRNCNILRVAIYLEQELKESGHKSLVEYLKDDKTIKKQWVGMVLPSTINFTLAVQEWLVDYNIFYSNSIHILELVKYSKNRNYRDGSHLGVRTVKQVKAQQFKRFMYAAILFDATVKDLKEATKNCGILKKYYSKNDIEKQIQQNKIKFYLFVSVSQFIVTLLFFKLINIY